MTFLMNILILATWVAPSSHREYSPEFNIDWCDCEALLVGLTLCRYPVIFYIFAGLHILFSFLVSTNYFLLNPPSPSALLEQILFLDHDGMVEFVAVMYPECC